MTPRPAAGGAAGATAPTWVFPFDRPLPPATGDNQALAVNTTNGSVKYDVAFSLVWADGSTALNKNEAYAFASCTDCRTVAVAFQVVLVAGQVDVVVPQNLSAALNYACVRCVTQALATQLVVSVPGALTDAQNAQLDAVWKELQAFGAHIEDVPLSELQSRLSGFEQQILGIVAPDAADAGTTPASTSAPSGGADERAGHRGGGGGQRRRRRDDGDRGPDRRRLGRRTRATRRPRPRPRRRRPRTAPATTARTPRRGRHPYRLRSLPGAAAAARRQWENESVLAAGRPRVRIAAAGALKQPRSARHLLQRPPRRLHRRHRTGQPHARPAQRHPVRGAAAPAARRAPGGAGRAAAGRWRPSSIPVRQYKLLASWVAEKLSRRQAQRAAAVALAVVGPRSSSSSSRPPSSASGPASRRCGCSPRPTRGSTPRCSTG